MFLLSPVGKKAHVQVCGTTPCRLRGAGELIDLCQHRIHHDQFHISADGNFSWEEVECLGACVNAPMVLIWNDTYEDLTKESFGKVLDGFASGQPPKPGPQNGRQFSAPMGGPTTLTGDVTGTRTAGPPKEPVLADAEAKKPGAAANVQERPAPKPPADDATKKGNV
jgi:NADH-quinone oxidoreductase subunit E